MGLNFPKHLVARLGSWEWMIYNENVTFVSCDEVRVRARVKVRVIRVRANPKLNPNPNQEGSLTYTGRGFNAERREVVPRPPGV